MPVDGKPKATEIVTEDKEMVDETIVEPNLTLHIPLVKCDQVLMSSISLLVLETTNLINVCKGNNASNSNNFEFESEIFTQLLHLVTNVPQNVQSVLEGIMTSLFCTNFSVIKFDKLKFHSILLIDFVNNIPDNRSLELFLTKFILTHRQTLANNA
jgi:hypothetical protein